LETVVPKSRPLKKLNEPLRFHGKNVLVTYQVRNPRGLVLRAFATDAKGRELPVAVLVHHFDRCYVEKLVRIVERPPGWGVSDRDLDQPDTRPWFLICAFKDTVIGSREVLYFLVNDDYEFYPLVVHEQRPRTGDEAQLDLASIYLMGSQYYSGGQIAWVDFSETDRLMVEAAIQAFLRKESLLT
jgi:hypothetical protein